MIIGYYLKNIHLPNMEIERNVFSEQKIDRATTPIINNNFKSLYKVIIDPLA
jgi:hypothetical protein